MPSLINPRTDQKTQDRPRCKHHWNRDYDSKISDQGIKFLVFFQHFKAIRREVRRKLL